MFLKTINREFILGLILFTFLSGEAAAQSNQKPTASRKAAAVTKKPAANYGKLDFSFKTLEGKTIRLSDYAGKVVLVNIWAPWCGPCRVEMPGFQKLYETYKSKGFEILGVAVQTNEEDVKRFVAQYDIAWPTGLNGDVATQYGTYGLPDNYLFNPDGSVAKHFVGLTREEVLKPHIEAALKRPSKE